VPFFSIIIPTYNSAFTIDKAIASILAQTFTNFEILVIDGLSKDDTILKVDSFADTRIKVFTGQDNGVYDAMNKGIQLAKGNWLYFIGSDDELFESNTLDKVHCFFKKNVSSNIIYGNVEFKNELPFWANGKKVYDGRFNYKKLLKKNICHQAIFYNLSFLNEHGFTYSLDFKVCSDWDFNLRVWKKSTFKYFNETIAKFDSGGISSIHSDEFYLKLETIVNDFYRDKSFYRLLKRYKYAKEKLFYFIKKSNAFKN
jgi:glycosyltransferase involved in cell wall biosynthesis